ncbi:DUF3592 domain-containing protein [Streptomyces sp. NPDC002730]|uniref:DUF3592 domain-containing protein n=1 Tax=Streptomyces sp. NPDC002730 TaxID=3364662 RepID=UPI0036B37426
MLTAIVVLVVTAGIGWLWFLLTRQLVRQLGSLFMGERAQGRCIRRYRSGTRNDPGEWTHVFEFTDADGARVEFEESVMVMAEGQQVTVRYQRRDPVRTATVIGRGGAWSPLFGQIGGVIIVGGFVALGLFISYNMIATEICGGGAYSTGC